MEGGQKGAAYRAVMPTARSMSENTERIRGGPRHVSLPAASDDGKQWKGQYERGPRHVRYADNGGVYDGESKANMREGRGKYRYPDGGVYEGEWKAGLREGLAHSVMATAGCTRASGRPI